MEAGGSPRPEPHRAGVPVWLAAVVVFVALAVGVAVVLVVRGGDDAPDAAPAEEPAATTELVLEPAGTGGRDPFTSSVAVSEKPMAADAALASTARVDGNQPGLYGGTQNQKVCDADALVSFLEQNPDKAAAWAGVLDITPTTIRDYVARLTPVLLRTDTRVTNHGFVDGAATPRQSVLQAGTAVLVDGYGVPRVRCSCGNPLTEPAPISALPAAIDSGEVTLVGQPWTDWQPTRVVVVTGDVAVSQFVVWDVVSGGTFIVLIGGSAPTTTTTQPPTTTTTAPPSTTTTTAAPLDPLSDDDCRNDPPPSDPEEYGSGDVGCDPSTGEYVCYLGAETVPCPGRP